MVNLASISKRMEGLYDSFLGKVKIGRQKRFEKLLVDLAKPETVPVQLSPSQKCLGDSFIL